MKKLATLLVLLSLGLFTVGPMVGCGGDTATDSGTDSTDTSTDTSAEGSDTSTDSTEATE